MKIAIITYHRAYNLGAKLQAYALQQKLSSEFDIDILDYRCDKIEEFYFPKVSLTRKIHDIFRKFFYPTYNKELIERINNYKKFDQYLKLSIAYDKNSVSMSNSIYDAFITGSDQVWNLDISGEDYNYMLAFADDEKKFSYAASFGNVDIDEKEKIHIKKVLSTFRILLVREQSALEYIRNMGLSNRAYLTIDPVFLLDKNEWIEKFHLFNTNQYKKKYIMMYFVSEYHQTYAIEIAKKIAKERKLQIIYLNAGKPLDRELSYKNNVGPIEFLQLILNSEVVVTTSFHAMAFSILFNKPFYYELVKKGNNVNSNSRLSDMARLFNVEDCEIKNDFINEEIQYNWEKINSKIRYLRHQSVNYLKESLKENVK